MTGALELRQVSRSYGEGATLVEALQAIDLCVDAGELVAIMGPSGSGKSTLLTIAGTLESATSGDVVVCGQDVATMSRNDRARNLDDLTPIPVMQLTAIAIGTPLVASIAGWLLAGREPPVLTRQPIE